MAEEKEEKKSVKKEDKKTEKKSKEKDKKEEEKEYTLSDLPGIGPSSIAKLEAAGIYDLMGIAVLTPPGLAETAGLGEAAARKAIQASRKMMKLGFQTGTDFAKKREEVGNIITGSENLDNLLGGKGVETKSMTEVFGAYGSGKCISKDTEVCYFNDTRMHVETIEETYDKYREELSEYLFEEGFAVPTPKIRVLAWVSGKLKIVSADYLYKEKVKKLLVIKTKRGRELKITGQHKLLSFEEGMAWKKASLIRRGDIIACPKNISMETEKVYNEEDAYFLGLFVAEGTSNPFSLTISETKIKNWVCKYIKNKFNYIPTVRIDNRGKTKYTILFRKATRELLRGLDQCNSATKFIPEEIFLSSKQVVASFLGGYLDGDGEVSDHDVSATTKSKRLAVQLTYLLLRMGISATVKERTAGNKGEKFKVVRVCGEDREMLKHIPFKLKSFKCNIRNSSYGYPKKIMEFISELYKDCIGGNRGRLRKSVGKINTQRTVYSNLIQNYNAKAINTKNLNKIEKIFETQKKEFSNIIKKLENERFSIHLLRFIYPKLPFAFNQLSEELGVNKKTMQNYYSRKIPSTKSQLLRTLILNELKTRVDTLCLALEIINEIRMFSWDIVESVNFIEYDDYVYDFVVPEGHSFIGGNMPTMMHNTQLGLSLAVNVQLPLNLGGANGKAVYIDTEGTFRPERIKQIAEAKGANPEKVLKNIFVARALNSDHQILLVDRIGEMIKDGEPIKIVIIDSLTAHFRAEYSGRGQLADRQQKLNRYLHNLMKIAEQYNLAVYVTNQVMANPAMMFGDPTTAVGGNIVGHMSTYRIYLRRGKKDSRVAKLIDSPNLPDNETVFFLTKEGLRDEP